MVRARMMTYPNTSGSLRGPNPSEGPHASTLHQHQSSATITVCPARMFLVVARERAKPGGQLTVRLS